MAKLNQIIAIEKGIKARAYSEVSELHKLNQKPALFNGFSKSYDPLDDAGEKLPSEQQRVQHNVKDVLKATERFMTEMMDTTARKDWTNCHAVADVVVGDTVILPGVPVTYLLFLEKQLSDLHAFAKTLPVLDSVENWTKDENSGLYKSGEVKTHRTKKTQRAIVLYEATDKHPAQAQLITEDLLAGYWTSVKQSGAMPLPDREALVERIEALMNAVKQAREEANSIEEASSPNVGEAFFNYLFP